MQTETQSSENAKGPIKSMGRGIFARMILKYPRSLLVLATAAVSAPSFMYLPLGVAVTVTGFVSLAIYLNFERKRRLFWEQSTSFKLMEINRRQDTLMDVLARDRSTVPRPRMSNQPPRAAAPVKRPPLTAKSRSYQDIAQDTPRTTSKRRPPSSLTPAAKKNAPTMKVSPAAQAKAEPSHFYSESLIREFIQTALNKETLHIAQNPIVRLSDGSARMITLDGQIEGYTGSYISSDLYSNAARKYGLNHKISTLLLRHAIAAARQSADMNYVVAIEHDTLNSNIFMAEVLKVMKTDRSLMSRLALEIKHDDFEDLPARTLNVMRSLAKLGAGFVLSNVSGDHIDVPIMRATNVKMVKISAATLAPKMKDVPSFRKALKMRRLLESQGMRVVIDGIDNQNILSEFADFAPSHAQGTFVTARAKTPTAKRVKAA